jgi:hypothetical protein
MKQTAEEIEHNVFETLHLKTSWNQLELVFLSSKS